MAHSSSIHSTTHVALNGFTPGAENVIFELSFSTSVSAEVKAVGMIDLLSTHREIVVLAREKRDARSKTEDDRNFIA